MADKYASHFGINNIPYGIATSSKCPQLQCVTRIGNDVIFLAELAKKGVFESISTSLHDLFLQPTLNAFAAQSREVHTKVRAAIQDAYKDKSASSATDDIANVKLHLPVQIGDFTD